MEVENSAQIIKYLDDAALKLMYSRLNSRFVVVNELPAVNTLSPDERKPIYLLNDGVGHVPYFIKDGEWEPAGITAEELEEKADRVEGAHAGNFAILDADGNLADANAKPSDFATAKQGEVAQEAYDLANSAYQKPVAGIPETDLARPVQESLELADTALQAEDIVDKADKVSGATDGHFASLNGEGNLADSGVSAADFSKVTKSSANGKIKVDGSDVTVYTHPSAKAAEPSAVQVGRDGNGHVVFGDALTKGDVGLGRVDNTSDADKPISTATKAELDKKVTAVAGKGLSTNDFTDADKSKLGNIEAGAQVNVQADWNAESGSPAEILHKPTGLVDDPSYQHTDNNYTDADKSKLGGIEAGAQVNVQADWEAASGSPSEILNKPTGLVDDPNYQHTDNNYTNADKNKLGRIEDGAQVNVQADWNAESGNPAEILNKPTGLVDDSNYNHTDNNYTDADKNKLGGIEDGAQVNVQADWKADSGSPSEILNKPTGLVDDPNYNHTDNNYTDADKSKLGGIEDGAQVNVQADWNAESGSSSEILHKPELTAVATTGNYSDLNGTPNLADVATTGDYGDLKNTPNLADVATTGNYSDLNGTPNLADVATTGDYGDLKNTPELATVATTGNYSDLSGKPNLATVATTGDYNDLKNTPTIPTVDQSYSASSTNAQSGTAVAEAIASIPGVTVDQSYSASSTNAQSGTAVAEAIASIPGVTVDQTYDATSTNAQSGTAVAEALATVPTVTVDQTYDATSANAQSGVAVAAALDAIPEPEVDQHYDETSANAQSGSAVAEAIAAIPEPTVDQAYDANSTNAQSGTAVAEAIATIQVDQTYDAASVNAQSGVAVSEAIDAIPIPTVDQTYDATSANAQSGVAVASAIGSIPIPTVDQTYDAASTHAQSGVAVSEAIDAIPIPTVDQAYDATSTNAQSGVAVASAISTIPVPTVDQTYNATSTNAQSGVAVAEAISGISVDEVPPVGSTDNGKVLTASYSGGTGSYAWAPGGGGGSGMAYQFASDDARFSWTQTPDDPDEPTIMTETLNVNLPKFVNVTSMPSTLQPNTYYFVYEE